MHPNPDSMRRARPLLGTFVEIAVAGAPPVEMEAAVEAAFTAVATVHRLMSFHDPQSDVSRLNREAFAGAVPVHAWTYQVLEAAIELNRQSSGVFDITVAPLLQQRGLLPRGAGDPAPAADRITAAGAVELLGDRRVQADRHGDEAERQRAVPEGSRGHP